MNKHTEPAAPATIQIGRYRVKVTRVPIAADDAAKRRTDLVSIMARAIQRERAARISSKP